MASARRRAAEPQDAREALGDIPEQLAALRAMTTGELRAKYREVFGVPSRSNNKEHLRKKIAWQIQANIEGGLSQRALNKIKRLGKNAPIRVRPTKAQRAAVNALFEREPAQEPEARPRDPRLPAPGTVLRREHQGVLHEVTVLDEGFEYRDQRYRSLSRIARAITGTAWNGFLFFGLANRKRKETRR